MPTHTLQFIRQPDQCVYQSSGITMADETLQTLPAIQNLDYHVVTLFQHMETMRKEELARSPLKPKQSMQAELLTLEFWR